MLSLIQLYSPHREFPVFHSSISWTFNLLLSTRSQKTLLSSLESHLGKRITLKPVPPIFSSTPPPDIRSLVYLKKQLCVRTSHKQYFLFRIFLPPTFLYSWVQVGIRGALRILYPKHQHRSKISALIFTVELTVIYGCLLSLTLLTPQPNTYCYLILYAGPSLNQSYCSTHPSIFSHFHVHLNNCLFPVIPWHIDFPTHDAVDPTAE